MGRPKSAIKPVWSKVNIAREDYLRLKDYTSKNGCTITKAISLMVRVAILNGKTTPELISELNKMQNKE